MLLLASTKLWFLLESEMEPQDVVSEWMDAVCLC